MNTHSMNSHALIVAALMCVLLRPAWCGAQSIWEITPYSVEIWCSIGDEPDLPKTWREDFKSSLDGQLRVVFRAACVGNVTAAPEAAAPLMQQDLASITVKDLLSITPTLNQQDKLFLVCIRGGRIGYQLAVREYDCQLAHLGPTDLVHVNSLADIPNRTVQLIAHAFSPVVRIDRYSDGIAKTRLRAAALIRGEDGFGTLQPGDILLPFDRRVSNDGRISLSDIRPIDWTYLQVPRQTDDIVGNGMLRVNSGYRQPFRSKRNRRNQQLALRARPTADGSVIRLQTRTKQPVPLIGYEIHETGSSGTSQFLGYTDWRGELLVTRNDTAIRTMLVRSGDRVLAKLPIVPGLRPVIVAAMTDDRQRVETDGFLSGVQTALIDLVAKRESLTARIRNLIKAGELDEAEDLLEQFQDLPTQADFQRELQQQQRALNVTDPSLRKRIDTMFVQTYRTLGQYLDNNRLRELQDELSAAR